MHKIFLKSSLIAIFSFISLHLLADDNTPLKELLKKDITFHSDLEERVMKKLYEGQKVSLLEMILATDKYTLISDYEKINLRVEDFIKRMDATTKTMTMQNKVFYIFRYTHSNFLRKYEAEIMASDLFVNGYYNCVTATALYAHIFDVLHIPYQIKELPTHVYLIVDPEKSKIPVESTDPMHGSIKPSQSIRKQYVKFLLESKTITQDELDSNGMENTFTKHYYSKTNINNKELVALQYSNMGLFSLERCKTLATPLPFFEKSIYLYESDQIKSLLSYMYHLYVSERTYMDTTCISVYLKAYYITPKENRPTLYFDEFLTIKNQVLVNRADVKLFDNYYQTIKSSIGNDSVLFKKIWFSYHCEKGRYALTKDDYKTTLRYACAASVIEPKNIELKQMIELAVTKQVITMSNPAKIIQMLNDLCASYEFVRQYKVVQDLYGFNYLQLADNYFDNKKREEGMALMESFEEFKQATIEPELISKVFIKASDLYLQINDKKNAKLFLDKGLIFAPQDKAILNKLKKLAI